MVRAFIQRNDTYLVSLIFRIYYVVFSISYPLLAFKNELPVHALNVYAAVAVLTTVLSFFSFRVYELSVTGVRFLAIAVSVLNILFFCTPLQTDPAYCYMFAVAMGVAASSIEFSSLSLATKDNRDKQLLKNSLVLMNILKVTGIAFGFLIGCLVSSGGAARQVGYCAVAIIALMCIFLSFGMAPISLVTEQFQEVSADVLRRHQGVAIFLFSVSLFVLDLTVFGFWFTALPTSLKDRGWGLEIIGVLLAAEAVVHALSQKAWHRLSTRVGDLVTYILSFTLHLAMLAFMLTVAVQGVVLIFLAFVLLGVSNSGTYITSSAFYYTRSWGLSRFQLIAIHQMASSVGKLLGPLAALQLMRI